MSLGNSVSRILRLARTGSAGTRSVAALEDLADGVGAASNEEYRYSRLLALAEGAENRVPRYSRALSGGSFTVPGPLLTKKSPSGTASSPFHLRNTGSGLRWQLTMQTVLLSTICVFGS